MAIQGWILFFFGVSLVISLAVIIHHYYGGRRGSDVEEPKYRMFDDED